LIGTFTGQQRCHIAVRLWCGGRRGRGVRVAGRAAGSPEGHGAAPQAGEAWPVPARVTGAGPREGRSSWGRPEIRRTPGTRRGPGLSLRRSRHVPVVPTTGMPIVVAALPGTLRPGRRAHHGHHPPPQDHPPRKPGHSPQKSRTLATSPQSRAGDDLPDGRLAGTGLVCRRQLDTATRLMAYADDGFAR
jgi:hypothetical protein